MKKVFLFLVPGLITNMLFGQQNATTDEGKKVVLNVDGTWEYVENKDFNEKEGCNYLTVETNKIYLNREKIGESGTFTLTGFLAKEDGKLYFHCSYSGEIGNVDEFSYATVKFEDNSTIELKGLERTDHRKPPVFIAEINDTYIFSRKKAVKIKLNLSNGFADALFIDKDFFSKSIECLR